MLWVVGAALAAGILRESSYLCIALILVFIVVRRCRATRKHALGMCLIALFCYAYGDLSARDYAQRREYFKRIAGTCHGTFRIDGWVRGYPTFRYGRTAFEFDATIGDVKLRLLVETTEFNIGYGDSLRIHGLLGPSKRAKYSREGYLRGRGLHGQVRVPAGGVKQLRGAGGDALTRHVLWPIHERLRCDTERGIGSRSGIPLALLVGERGLLDRQTRQAFVTLGISHLLALSGLHLGFVVGLLLLVLRRLPVWKGRILILALASYVGFVGPIFSLYRAFVMAAVLIGARAVHRPMQPMSALGAAFVLIVLVFPHALFSVGFQLSFLATLGVLLCVARFPLPGGTGVIQLVRSYAVSTLVISIGVQVLVAPVILYYFGRVSVMSPVATLIFVFPVAVVLFGSAFCAAVSAVAPNAAMPLYALLDQAAYLLGEALEIGAHWSPALLELPTPNPLLYFGGVVLLWRRRCPKWTRVVGLCMFVAAFVA